MVEEFYQFFREMESGGIAGYAPENVLQVVDINKEEEDEKE